MELFEAIETRHSIRAFSERRLSKEKLQRILAAANQAPSAGNLQANEIYVFSQPRQRLELARAAGDQMFIAEAAFVLVFAAHPDRSAQKYGRRGEQLYAIQDATIACSFAMLAATALEIASVWVGAFDEEQVKRAARIQGNVHPIAILPLGYAAEEPRLRGRRPLDEIVHYIQE